jgi:hypothetical protein
MTPASLENSSLWPAFSGAGRLDRGLDVTQEQASEAVKTPGA